MSVLAKLLELSALDTQDRSGEDEIVLSRIGGVQFFPTSGTVPMREGSTEQLGIFVPVDDEVRLSLHEVDAGSGLPAADLGVVTISASEAGQGEKRQDFTGAGAHYELRYVVV